MLIIENYEVSGEKGSEWRTYIKFWRVGAFTHKAFTIIVLQLLCILFWGVVNWIILLYNHYLFNFTLDWWVRDCCVCCFSVVWCVGFAWVSKFNWIFSSICSSFLISCLICGFVIAVFVVFLWFVGFVLRGLVNLIRYSALYPNQF